MTGKRLLTKDEFDLYVANLEQRLAGMGISPTGSGGGDIEAHNILSATHNDTTMAACVRGDVVIGNPTPQWSKLAIGTVNKLLKSDGADIAWNFVNLIELADTPAIYTGHAEKILIVNEAGNAVAFSFNPYEKIVTHEGEVIIEDGQVVFI